MDSEGLKVYLAEKAIESCSICGIGGHVWLIIEPDNYLVTWFKVYYSTGLDIDKLLDSNNRFVLRSGPSSGTGGKLIKSIGYGNSTTVWRQRYLLKPPTGSDDSQFIVDLLEAAISYQNNLDYDGFASGSKYNSNSFIAGLLVAAGTPVNNIPDPWYYQPGLDKPIPLNSTKGGF